MRSRPVGALDVVLRVGGSPENVRTARLVAAAVARRAGLSEERVDEVRIAVGEAVTWAMQAAGPSPVELVLGPGAAEVGGFEVRVSGGLAPVADLSGTGDLVPGGGDGLALALLRGLADGVQTTAGTTVLTWGDAPST